MQSVKSEKRDSKSKQKIFIKVSVLAQESSPFKQYYITIKCTKMKMIEPWKNKINQPLVPTCSEMHE